MAVIWGSLRCRLAGVCAELLTTPQLSTHHPSGKGDSAPNRLKTGFCPACSCTQADKVVNDSTAWIIRTKGGKVVQTLISEVSADGKTWTVTTAGVTPDGQQINNVLVREKQ